jgi:NAD(P) transhydrogenase subunit alpha
MATLAGYKAVVMAADRLQRIFPLLTTAAGTIVPATVLVLGAGVAGLQAIATAKRLGARVEAFDPRPVVKEQVESVGAVFVPMETLEDVQTAGGYAKEQSEDFLRRERDTITARLPKCDVVVATAQVFGKRAPLLITEDMVKRLPRGAVIVDLAAEQGGNCELTQPGVVIEKHGVTIFGTINLPAALPINASSIYAKNVAALFGHLYKNPANGLDFEDEITRSACLTHDGRIVNEPVRLAVG